MPLRPELVAVAAVLGLSGCGEAEGPSRSVTMKLPPARPADAQPGFSALDEAPVRKSLS